MLPSHPVTFWHYFDFITLTASFLIVTSLVGIHYKKTGGLRSSVSQTVAYTQKSSLIFSITMTTFFPLYNAYLWFWVLPSVFAPYWLYLLLIVSSISEVIVAWVPATSGKRKWIHGLTAGVVGLFMWLFIMGILLEGRGLSSLSRICLVSSIVISLILLAAMTNKRLKNFTFLYETVYCAMFLLALSVVGHT